MAKDYPYSIGMLLTLFYNRKVTIAARPAIKEREYFSRPPEGPDAALPVWVAL